MIHLLSFVFATTPILTEENIGAALSSGRVSISKNMDYSRADVYSRGNTGPKNDEKDCFAEKFTANAMCGLWDLSMYEGLMYENDSEKPQRPTGSFANYELIRNHKDDAPYNSATANPLWESIGAEDRVEILRILNRFISLEHKDILLGRAAGSVKVNIVLGVRSTPQL